MMSWVFLGGTLVAVVAATVITDIRRATLALWVAGLSVGALYLTLGAELLAVIQWIVSTLIAISFIFFSAMFGDYGTRDRPRDLAAWLRASVPYLIGLGFAGVVWVGAGMPGPGATSTSTSMPEPGNDLISVGRELMRNHLISLEVLGFTLFVVLIGGGILARPEGGTPDYEGPRPQPGPEVEGTPAHGGSA